MIEIVEAKDVKYLFSRLEEINERTKKHTKQIKELEKSLKAN